MPAIADDSGIEVDLLAGEPGIYSARYAGQGASDEDNLRLLLEKIEPFKDQQINAKCQCAMVYIHHPRDPTPLIAQASWDGYIVSEPRGIPVSVMIPFSTCQTMTVLRLNCRPM